MKIRVFLAHQRARWFGPVAEVVASILSWFIRRSKRWVFDVDIYRPHDFWLWRVRRRDAVRRAEGR